MVVSCRPSPFSRSFEYILKKEETETPSQLLSSYVILTHENSNRLIIFLSFFFMYQNISTFYFIGAKDVTYNKGNEKKMALKVKKK